MKPDVLTLAVVIFLVGILASGLGMTEMFQGDSAPTAELQQGVATR